MSRYPRKLNQRTDQAGFTLIAVLFLLVGLAALAVYIVTLSGTQQQTPIQGLEASRAYYAARSAIEARSFELLEGGDGGCPASSETYTLDGFSVTVEVPECEAHPSGQGTVYTLTARAEKPAGGYGSLNYVSRRLTAQITDYEW